MCSCQARLKFSGEVDECKPLPMRRTPGATAGPSSRTVATSRCTSSALIVDGPAPAPAPAPAALTPAAPAPFCRRASATASAVVVPPCAPSLPAPNRAPRSGDTSCAMLRSSARLRLSSIVSLMAPPFRGLHSSNFRLNVSSSCWMLWVHDLPPVY